MKARSKAREGAETAGAKGRRRRSVKNDKPYACYLCFLGPGLKYFVPVAFGPLPLKLKRDLEFAVQN